MQNVRCLRNRELEMANVDKIAELRGISTIEAIDYWNQVSAAAGMRLTTYEVLTALLDQGACAASITADQLVEKKKALETDNRKREEELKSTEAARLKELANQRALEQRAKVVQKRKAIEEEIAAKKREVTYTLEGNWSKGIAFDLHTLSSEYLGQDENGHDQYDTKRSEMGELVYQLKYKYDTSAVSKIVDLIQGVGNLSSLDAFVAIPPTNKNRRHQPVYLIVTEMGKRFNVPVYLDALEKKGGHQLKEIEDVEERSKELLQTMYFSKKHDLTDKKVLLIDDLFRSGATLNVATQILLEEANVKRVNVLTMTKTRRNR